MTADPSPSPPLKLFFVPHFAPSHVIPFFEIARLFAARGQHVTVITTPAIAAILQTTVDKDNTAGHNISLHLVHPPTPEDFGYVPDEETAGRHYRAFLHLRQKIEEFIVAGRPDCVLTDSFPWTAGAGANLHIPRVLFNVSCAFSISLEDALDRPDSAHWKIQSDDEPFNIPGLPDPITLTRSQLPLKAFDPNVVAQMKNEVKQVERKSHGTVLNSFDELEWAYTQHYNKVSGSRVFNVGPVALIHRNSSEKAERVYNTAAAAAGEHECLRWLNSKEPKSVLYVCFGSTCSFPDHQLMELASGLENSGHNFLWAVRGKENYDDRKWLPEGFVERTKERGMIARGWVPQILILDHPSLGGFLTHCGWNSVSESVSAGVPMITWPVHSEQFYNQKLVCQVLGIGVEGGAMEYRSLYDQGNVVIEGGKIAKAVRRLMNGDDEAVQTIRRKAKEISKMAKRAVEEGGSSHRNLTVLIEELQQLRDQKAKA